MDRLGNRSQIAWLVAIMECAANVCARGPPMGTICKPSSPLKFSVIEEAQSPQSQ